MLIKIKIKTNKIIDLYYYTYLLKSKGGIIIENKVLKLKNLVESEDCIKFKQILNEVLDLNIKEIKYDSNLEMSNISEYEFELVKVKAILYSNEEVEMYLKMIKNTRVKESIFCYWCSIYEEELMKAKELEDIDMFINKVLISELDKTKYQKRIFLTIEDNKTKILETGTEVNFIEIKDYIEEHSNQYEDLYKYFDKESKDVLLVGIKMNRMEKLH